MRRRSPAGRCREDFGWLPARGEQQAACSAQPGANHATGVNQVTAGGRLNVQHVACPSRRKPNCLKSYPNCGPWLPNPRRQRCGKLSTCWRTDTPRWLLPLPAKMRRRALGHGAFPSLRDRAAGSNACHHDLGFDFPQRRSDHRRRAGWRQSLRLASHVEHGADEGALGSGVNGSLAR